jgi:hypothetical protein
MYVNEHQRLSNFTLKSKLKGTACSKKGYVGKWTPETKAWLYVCSLLKNPTVTEMQTAKKAIFLCLILCLSVIT